MSENNHADLLVIGAGPGGYASAFRAADLGRRVVLVDPRENLGGVCLNEGCIPSKALLHAAEAIREASAMGDWGIDLGEPRIDLDALRRKKDGIVAHLTGGLGQLAKKRRVERVQGTATFIGANRVSVSAPGGSEEWTFDQAVIAVGSSPVVLPDWPDDPRIMDSSGALELRRIPKRLAIVGGGVIGLEMATVYAALGSDVTVIELAPQILPGVDAKAAGILREALAEQGCTIHTATAVNRVTANTSSVVLEHEGEANGTLRVDAVIQAVGRRASGRSLGAERAGVALADDGHIPVDETCRTSVPHIFAIGDVTGGPMLAHRATHQGKVAAEVASGHQAAFDTALIPSVAYTNPEIAWVGLTAEQAKAGAVAHKVAAFPWEASGRNLCCDGGGGVTRIVYCPESLRLLGATLVGRNAGELIAELVVAMENGLVLEDLALSIHPHPTLSESIAFASELALGTCTDL